MQPPKPRARKSALPKLIEKYYADIEELKLQNVLFEMGTRPAFHELLGAEGKTHGWTLIAEQEKKVNVVVTLNYSLSGGQTGALVFKRYEG